MTNKFIDGGATGDFVVGFCVDRNSDLLLNSAINLPFIIMGHKTVGINFAVKQPFAIGGFSIGLANVTSNVTNDNILVAVLVVSFF